MNEEQPIPYLGRRPSQPYPGDGASVPALPRRHRGARLGSSGLVAAALRQIARWRERERERRELAMMSIRDFGDLAVPPGLVREELRRWPWQAWGQGWNALAAASKWSWRAAKATNTGAPQLIGQANDFAIAVIFSLVGLNLTLWVLFHGGFAGTAYTEVGGFLPGM